MLLLGVAIACSGTKDMNEPGDNAGGAGSAHSAGAPAAGASNEAGSADDTTPGGAGGTGGQLNSGGIGGIGGIGGVASVQFWTEATQHVEIACFGFFDGFATFHADRAQLNAEQLALLANQTGVPGSTYDDNDDQIHCVVTTSDAEEHERQFTIDGTSDLIGPATNIAGEGGEGGEGGAEPVDYPVEAVLGCEFHHPFANGAGWGQYPFSADPLCVRKLWADGKSSSFGLDLAVAGKPYHIELIHCSQKPTGDMTIQLFGADPETPLASGVAPADDPGPDNACLVLDAQVEASVVARLVFSSPSSKLTSQEMTFR